MGGAWPQGDPTPSSSSGSSDSRGLLPSEAEAPHAPLHVGRQSMSRIRTDAALAQTTPVRFPASGCGMRLQDRMTRGGGRNQTYRPTDTRQNILKCLLSLAHPEATPHVWTTITQNPELTSPRRAEPPSAPRGRAGSPASAAGPAVHLSPAPDAERLLSTPGPRTRSVTGRGTRGRPRTEAGRAASARRLTFFFDASDFFDMFFSFLCRCLRT